MSSCSHLVWLVLLVVIPAATGLGKGAPRGACVTMSPNHNNTNVQPSKSPYSLVVESVDKEAKTRKVCVKGATFKGILLQVRAGNGMDPVGTFDGTKLPNKTKLMTCSTANDSITHSKPEDKANPTCFTWKIPDTDIKEDLKVFATIAESKTVYWEEITSETFKISGAPAQGLMFATIALCSLMTFVAGIME